MKEYCDVERFCKLLNKTGTEYRLVQDTIWRYYNKMFIPLGPVNKNYTNIADKKIFNKGILIRKNKPSNLNDSKWYSVVCNKFVHLDEMNSKLRYQVKKSLKSCEVRKVTANFVAENCYEILIKSLESYNSDVSYISENEFKNGILKYDEFDDIVDFWGVFINEKIVAYSIVNKYYSEVEYSVIKINPEYRKSTPIYSLIYIMNKYYLEEKKYDLVNDGFRCLLHDTNIQNFLISKFNFKKFYLDMEIDYRLGIGIIMKITYNMRSFIGKIDKRIEALYKLEAIRRGEE